MDPHRAQVFLNQLNTWLQGPRLKDLAGLHSELRYLINPDKRDVEVRPIRLAGHQAAQSLWTRQLGHWRLRYPSGGS
jgi:hypothetical protein